MKKNHLVLLAGLLLATFSIASSAHAAGLSPIGLSIFPPVQLPPQNFDVVGVRANIGVGDHREVFGLDVGVIGNETDLAFAGVQVAGGFNYNKGTATAVGIQAAGGANVNVNKTHVIGVQVAGITNYNEAESSVVGLQVSLVNYAAHTNIYGIQAGVYNRANVVNGFQIGLINVANNLHGIQVGLANFNKDGLFAFAPILNVGF